MKKKNYAMETLLVFQNIFMILVLLGFGIYFLTTKNPWIGFIFFGHIFAQLAGYFVLMHKFFPSTNSKEETKDEQFQY
jgi:hypothetical protein